MVQMKEQIKPPEKELSDEELDNPSDAEFKTLVKKMLTEIIEFGCKMKEEMKTIQSEIKENRDSNQQFGTKGRNTSKQNRMKKQEFKTMRRDLGTSGTTLNIPTSES